MNKKGIQMSLEVVIAAIILLVVLAVVLFIFLSGTGRQRGVFDDTLDQTERCLPWQTDRTDCDWVEGGFVPILLCPLLKRKVRHQ